MYHGPKFAIDAIEEGKCAAESLHRYVHKGADMKIGRNRRDFIMLDKDNISVSGYDHAGRQEAGMDESIPKHSFRDAHKTLTAEQVKIETARCGLRRQLGRPQQVHRLRRVYHQMRLRCHSSETGSPRVLQDDEGGGQGQGHHPHGR